MKIAIVDDERPSRSELCYFIKKLLPDAELLDADSGTKAVELSAANQIDIFFLDINLGDINGITLATMLRQAQPNAAVVFSTAYDAYALKAFDIGATDYIMKPYSETRVHAAIHKAMHSFSHAPTAPTAQTTIPRQAKLPVSRDKKVILLNIPEIAYIEKENRHCKIICDQQEFITSATLDSLEKQLSGQPFLRIHKSFIVNLNNITEISPWFNSTFMVVLSTPENKTLPVGRTYIRPLRETLGL